MLSKHFRLEINMFLPPGHYRKKHPSPRLGLLMARLYKLGFSTKCHKFRGISVEICWLYSPRSSAQPWFILQKHTAGSQFHRCSFPQFLLLDLGLTASLLLGSGAGFGGLAPPPAPSIFSIFLSSLSLCQCDSHHFGDLAQQAGAAWCVWYRHEARTFCVG